MRCVTAAPGAGATVRRDGLWCENSGMLVRAERAGVVTYVDSQRILIDNADEYVLRKFVGLNERTCQNQKPIIKKGQRVKKGQIIADGAATRQGELALGRNCLVAFMTFDGYNFEDAIVINERFVKDDVFTSIHIDNYDVEIRETKPENIIISVDPKGNLFWYDAKLPDTEALVTKLKAVSQMKPQPEVQIRGDMAARYEGVGKILLACQRAGITKVAFITEPPPLGG